MNFYRQAIILFGMVFPILGGLLVLGAASFIKNSLAQDSATKAEEAKRFAASQLTANALEQQVATRRASQSRWDELFKERPITQINAHVGRLEKSLGKEFQRSNTEESPTATGFGTISKQKSSQVIQAYRGTYRGIQHALLDIETRMPQLQLNDLTIEPSSQRDSNHVSVTAKYTAWEK